MLQDRVEDREECEMEEVVDSPIKITKKMFDNESNQQVLPPLKMSSVETIRDRIGSIEETKTGYPKNLIVLTPNEIPLTQRTLDDEGSQ